MTVDEQRLYATTDAAVWAEEWCKAARELSDDAPGADPLIDESWITSWFANAIETAKMLEGRRIHDEGLVWSTHKLSNGTEVGGQWVKPPGYPIQRPTARWNPGRRLLRSGRKGE